MKVKSLKKRYPKKNKNKMTKTAKKIVTSKIQRTQNYNKGLMILCFSSQSSKIILNKS